MTRTSQALMGATLFVCAIASAQDSGGDRVVVPARNTTHPRVVYAGLMRGTITVKVHAAKDVIVETGAHTSRSSERTYDGLKRIDLPPRGLTVEEDDNVIHIRTGAISSSANLTITVPVDTSVHLTSTSGDLVVEGLHGEIEVKTTSGNIRATGISGSVLAHTSNGSIKVAMDKVDSGKPLSFSSNNGEVEVTLPADLKANLKFRSLHGAIYSDFEIKLSGSQSLTGRGGDQGPFRVQLDKTIIGTINGGGTTEASFATLNGKILIKKK